MIQRELKKMELDANNEWISLDSVLLTLKNQLTVRVWVFVLTVVGKKTDSPDIR